MTLSRSQIGSVLIGNIIEHYDTALFALLSPFLAPLFFPEQSPIVALILTYCIVPLGLLAKPVGSLIFGRIGDSWGRIAALRLSLFGTALASLWMMALPTAHEIGIFAPILLAVGRVLQTFFSSAETIGGALCILETSEESRKDFLSGAYSASTIAGILLASCSVMVLSSFNLIEYWRVLYLLGASTAFIGTLLRAYTSEITTTHRENFSLNLFWQYRRPIFSIALTAGFSYATYSIALVLMNGFLPLITSTSAKQALELNSALLCLDFLLLPLFGYLSGKFGRERMMVSAAALTAMLGAPLFMLLEGASFAIIAAVRLIFVILGVWFCASFHAWSQELVPRKNRYTIVAFAYALGAQIFGTPTTAITLWIYHETGSVTLSSLYWVCLAFSATVAVGVDAIMSPVQNEQR